MRAVAYARVSSDSDEQKHSLQTQMDYFKEYIEKSGHVMADTGILCKRDGKHVPIQGIYADEGISGTSLKRRDAFNLMIKHAKQRKFDLIMTKSMSRFGRSVEDVVSTIKDLKQLGVGVYFEDIQKSTLDGANEFIVNMFAALAQEESRHKSDITQFGIRKAQREGKWISNAPLGYDKANGKLQVNESEAEVVRQIFEMFYQGHGTQKIARTLEAQGIKTKQNKRWQQPQICKILDNPIYVGRQVTHRFQILDINRHLQVEVPEDEQIVHLYEHLRIIDDDLFNLVQVERQRRKAFTREGAGRSRYSNATLFSNLLYCGQCGSALKRKKRHSKGRDGTKKDIGYEWRCRLNDMYGRTRCPNPNSVTEEYLLQYIKEELIKHKESKHEYTLDHYLYTYLDRGEYEQQLAYVNEQLAELQTEMDTNLRLHSKGVIDEEQFADNNTIQIKRKRELTAELNRLLHIDDEIERAKAKFNEFRMFLEQVDVKQLTNDVLRRLISRVTVATLDESFADMFDTLRVIEIDWAFLDKSEDEVIYDMAQKDIAMGKQQNPDEEEDYGDFDPDELPFEE